ncbi:transaldolase [Endothiovibrio diazotrophicus]
MNPLNELSHHGQSYWLDNLTRRMLEDGSLKRRVVTESLRGVTSNPAIFNKAISSGDEYRAPIARLAADGLSTPAIYERLAVADVTDACDQLLPVYRRTDGRDGFVSLEVSPHLADDAWASVAEAERLHAAVGRPNLMIKVPATRAGLEAGEALLRRGIHVNFTLIFTRSRYAEVADRYLCALEWRREHGEPVAEVASVASCFLSRIDGAVDRRLEALGGEAAAGLSGRAAVANAKLIYRHFSDLLDGVRWARLGAAGAQAQRPLWASTSVKNPAYPDLLYVEPLIGPYTVNTLPEGTIDALREHGRVVGGTVSEGIDEAERVVAELAALGIDLEEVGDELLADGLRLFVEPFDALLATIDGLRPGEARRSAG